MFGVLIDVASALRSLTAFTSENKFIQSCNVLRFTFLIKSCCWYVKIVTYCAQHGNAQLFEAISFVHGTNMQVIKHYRMEQLYLVKYNLSCGIQHLLVLSSCDIELRNITLT